MIKHLQNICEMTRLKWLIPKLTHTKVYPEIEIQIQTIANQNNPKLFRKDKSKREKPMILSQKRQRSKEIAILIKIVLKLILKKELSKKKIF